MDSGIDLELTKGPENPNTREECELVGELDRKDLEILDQLGPEHTVPPLKHVRVFHHRIARLLAIGIREIEIAEQFCLSPSTISNLKKSPQFQELLAGYSEQAAAKDFDMGEMLGAVGMECLSLLHERILNPETRAGFSNETLRRLATDMADRKGHAPVRKTEERHFHGLDPGTLELVRQRNQENALLEKPPADRPSLSRVSQLKALSRAEPEIVVELSKTGNSVSELVREVPVEVGPTGAEALD